MNTKDVNGQLINKSAHPIFKSMSYPLLVNKFPIVHLPRVNRVLCYLVSTDANYIIPWYHSDGHTDSNSRSPLLFIRYISAQVQISKWQPTTTKLCLCSIFLSRQFKCFTQALVFRSTSIISSTQIRWLCFAAEGVTGHLFHSCPVFY